MSNFYERQMRRMFGDSEVLSADTIFAGKAMVSKISDDLRANVIFPVVDLILAVMFFVKLGTACNRGKRRISHLHRNG